MKSVGIPARLVRTRDYGPHLQFLAPLLSLNTASLLYLGSLICAFTPIGHLPMLAPSLSCFADLHALLLAVKY